MEMFVILPLKDRFTSFQICLKAIVGTQFFFLALIIAPVHPAH